MLFAVLSGFLLALGAPWLHRYSPRSSGWLLAMLPAGLFVYFLLHVVPVSGGERITETYHWVSALGIALSFSLDGLSLLFALLICGIGLFIFIYSAGYLKGHEQAGRFYSFLLGFMASMLGVVLADNAVVLFVFWELTSLASYFLIGFEHEREKARSAALQALLVTALGGLGLLAGLILLGNAGGSMEISRLLDQDVNVRNHPLYLPVVLLIFLGAFTKSAQVPFHFWLPSAMEAPTPVSAYLHSATMVKAGIYLLARLAPVLGGTGLWQNTLIFIGGATMVVGAVIAIRERDLKRILAYSTVSSLGTLALLIGIDTRAAIGAAVVYLFAHALYKGSLFLVAGAVDQKTGTRNVLELSGLRKAMPLTAVAGIAAALSMAGLPPSLGYISKELLYEAQVHGPRWPALAAGASLIANALLVAVSVITGGRPFFGRPGHGRKIHEAPSSMVIGALALAVAGISLSFFPALIRPVLEPAAAVATASREHLSLGFWRGFNMVLLLSAVTYLLGVLAYTFRDRVRSTGRGRAPALSQLYDRSLNGLLGFGELQTRILQNGRLRFYIMTVLAAALVLIGGFFLVLNVPFSSPASMREVRFHEFAAAVIILGGALTAATARTRLIAIAALGAVGYGVALVYLFFSAPDLAMTQFSIETLMVILYVLVLYSLPRFAVLSSRISTARDAVMAAANGALIAVLVLFAVSEGSRSRISSYFLENTLSEAQGHNTVNVILVDFRALDTLGEITVLAVAGLGVFALMRGFPGKGAGP